MIMAPGNFDAPMDLSVKTRRKLPLEEFLRQNLDHAPAGRVIQWVKREEGIFRILWTHQSSGAFTKEDAALFRYWALARGKAANLSSVELKQSLRMALNKSPSVERVSAMHDEYRYFKFTDWANKRSRHRASSTHSSHDTPTNRQTSFNNTSSSPFAYPSVETDIMALEERLSTNRCPLSFASIEQQYSVDGSSTDRYSTDRHSVDQYSTDRHSMDQYSTDRYSTDSSSSIDHYSTDHSSDCYSTGHCQIDCPSTDLSSTGHSSTDRYSRDHYAKDRCNSLECYSFDPYLPSEIFQLPSEQDITHDSSSAHYQESLLATRDHHQRERERLPSGSCLPFQVAAAIDSVHRVHSADHLYTKKDIKYYLNLYSDTLSKTSQGHHQPVVPSAISAFCHSYESFYKSMISNHKNQDLQ